MPGSGPNGAYDTANYPADLAAVRAQLGLTALARMLPAKLGAVQTRRHMGNNGSLTGGGNLTLSTMFSAEAQFTMVRVVVYNGSTTDSVTIGKMSIAATAAIGDGFSPVDESGAAVTPVAVTWNNAGADGEPPSPTGSTRSITLASPATASPSTDVIATRMYSDWIPLSSFARTDGGSLPLVILRMYDGTSKLPLHNNDSTGFWSDNWATINNGRIEKTYYKTGDFTTEANWSGFTSPTLLQTGPLVALEFYGPRGLSIIGVGDSLTLGQNTTAWCNSWGKMVANSLSTPDFPVCWGNYGFGGSTSPAFYNRAKLVIDDLRPDMIVLPCWSPNDGTITNATITASVARVVALADYAIRKGIIPVITTAMPTIGTNAGTDALRIKMNNRVRSLGRNFLVADFDAAVTDGATPARLRSIYDSGDGLHINDAGHAACAAVLSPIVQAVVSASL